METETDGLIITDGFTCDCGDPNCLKGQGSFSDSEPATVDDIRSECQAAINEWIAQGQPIYSESSILAFLGDCGGLTLLDRE